MGEVLVTDLLNQGENPEGYLQGICERFSCSKCGRKGEPEEIRIVWAEGGNGRYHL